MMENILPILLKSLMITGFVFVMMLVIEYINVQTNGIWQNKLSGNAWKQYFLAAVLGAIPGCLGAFTAVALFSHRLISFGAVVAAMIATSGDEAFVMFAMFPQKALLLTIIILIVGIIAGYLTDKLYTPHKILNRFIDNSFPLHSKKEECNCFQKDKFLSQLFRPSVYRLLLLFFMLLFLIAILTKLIAGDAKQWIKITLLLAVSFSLFVVITVPEHFLKEHLWEHIVMKHIPRIFFWTFGTLLAFGILMNYINVEEWLSNNMLIVLFLSVLIGIIPESGPHLIFVTLFAQGTIPFSVLLASSVSQDGHGMLPLLAESKRGFLAVKIVNIIVALIVGLSGYLIGF
ncbi:MAG: arsenic efflux protein [Prolixibacteraceae bacterium]|nr:arsenic efflux protein [Prolixibacteraceae bacterium]